MTATIIVHPAAAASAVIASAVAAVLEILDPEQVAALVSAVDRPAGPHLAPARPGQLVLDGGYAPLPVLQSLVRVQLADPEVRAGLLVGVTLNIAGATVRHHLAWDGES